tara:strand:+ start:384 stop:605 length:222 start_codon:yes stop_codon:yes gene_type:complete
MFKITNKQTGFKQYRNSKETADFVFKNDYNKYTIEEIPTINTEKIEKILEGFFTIVTVVLLFTFSYILLWTVY